MKIFFTKAVHLLRDTLYAYTEDDAPRLGAALAFYTILSLPPALMLITAVTTSFIDAQVVHGQLNQHLREVLGERIAAIVIQIADSSAYRPKANFLHTFVGIISAIISAMGASVQLQASLNLIWRVRAKPGRGNIIVNFIKSRLVSMLMVASVGAFVVVGLLISAILTFVSQYTADWLSGELYSLLQTGNFLVSYGLFFLVFAVVFRYVPDVELRWSDVWLGAIVTTILFSIGRYLIGIYLLQMDVVNAYGVAGSLVVLMVWFFYTMQILFFGAELTKVHYLHKGNRIRPRPYAVKFDAVMMD